MEAKKHLLLLGAGFSRNWGGWLASEVFEYLLAAPEIADNPELRGLLWSTKLKGRGFEDALADLQAQYARLQNAASQKLLDKLQTAVAKMFQDMNEGLERCTFEFSNNTENLLRTFLARFDAIFTLNQDVLLESITPLCKVLRRTNGPDGYFQAYSPTKSAGNYPCPARIGHPAVSIRSRWFSTDLQASRFRELASPRR